MSSSADVDLDALRAALERHPVRLGVLFGSEAIGETHPRSDLDVAVEFRDDVDDVPTAYRSLLTDLGSAVGRNDVDLSLVSDLKPQVGLAAFSDGVLITGDRARMETHRRRFERIVADRERSEPSLRERFDAVIEGVDEALTERP